MEQDLGLHETKIKTELRKTTDNTLRSHSHPHESREGRHQIDPLIHWINCDYKYQMVSLFKIS